MSLQHVVSKASTELHVVVKWHKIRIMKFTNLWWEFHNYQNELFEYNM